MRGHEKGAFTGAIKQTKGRFELADGGTLLLDEISEIKPPLQAKLLRVLQEREFERVGSGTPIKVDVRIVATTNRNLQEQIEKGVFREDLYYRLNVIPMQLSSMRERKEDIPRLIAHFLEKYNRENDKTISGVSEKAMELLMAYDWPGNVRELENEINRLVAMSDYDMSPDLLSPKIREGTQTKTGTANDSLLAKYFNRSLKEVEYEFMRDIILYTLEETNWHRTKAAKILKVPTSTLFNKMKKYGIG